MKGTIINPRVVHEWQVEQLFGLIRISYEIVDRHPDLDSVSGGKYDNFLKVVIFGNVYQWRYRSDHFYDDQPYQ